jgi:hypothetical protein
MWATVSLFRVDSWILRTIHEATVLSVKQI